MYTIKRTEMEIDEVLDEASENIDAGTTKYSGLSYENGLQEMFDWLTADESEASPME